MKVQVMTNILAGNDRIAAENREHFRSRGIFVLNLLGSPGAGKTMLLEQTIMHLRTALNLAVIEGDLYTEKDAERIARHGVAVVQINTEGGCHLDAAMVAAALENMNMDKIDLLIVENVGNLVCPAEFDVGEDVKAVVLSITEGADKPLKYPLAFRQAAAAVLNKVDLLPYTDMDMEAVRRDICSLNPKIQLFAASCRTGEGLEEWCGWLQEQVRRKKGGESMPSKKEGY